MKKSRRNQKPTSKEPPDPPYWVKTCFCAGCEKLLVSMNDPVSFRWYHLPYHCRWHGKTMDLAKYRVKDRPYCGTCVGDMMLMRGDTWRPGD